MTVRTRIAPSPTGIAHLGTAYIAMRNLALARQGKGQFIVRIEDTDRQRYVEGGVEAVLEGLAWLGLAHDEGPDVGGPHAPYTQSERLNLYTDYAHRLVDQDHAYYCFCTKERLDAVRREQLTAKQLPRYDLHCRTLSKEEAAQRAKTEPHVIRLKVSKSDTTTVHDLIRGDVAFENSGLDDQVLLKSDGFPTYHLGVVVDDHLMGITHIIRGEEWLPSSPKHVLLYEAFGWPLPAFAHLPVIRNKDKSKMSKRKNDVSILSHRARGYLPEAILNFLALMGWSHPDKKEVFPFSDFLRYFSLERVTKTAPVYDPAKLNWLNGQYIRALTDTELLSRLKFFIPADCPASLASELIPLIKERLVTLCDFEALTQFFYRDVTVDQDLLCKKSTPDIVHAQLLASIKLLQAQKNISPLELESAFRQLATNEGWKPSQYFMMLRLALTGESATPPLFDTMAVFGIATLLKRLNKLV